jgi:hypothetical protein
MNSNFTQPEEIDMVMKELSDDFAKSEIENTRTVKSKSSRETSDDEYYIPLYKTRCFN